MRNPTRRLWLPALLLALLFILSGCASSPASPVLVAEESTNYEGVEHPAEDQAEPQATTDASGGETITSGDSGTGSLPPINTGNVAASGKKMIYTVTLSLEAEDPKAVLSGVQKAVDEAGGYVAGSEFYGDGQYQSSTITVRVPPEKLQSFTAAVGALGRVLESQMSSQDVTDQYTDLESQLRNAQAQETQLLEVLKKAEKIDDILKVREQLNQVQQEIEMCKGQLRLMDNQVGYSTVTISVRQPEKPAVTDDEGDRPLQFWGFSTIGNKISLAFRSSVNWTMNAIGAVLMVLGYLSIPLVIVAAIVLVVVLLVRRANRRRPAPRPPAAPPHA